MQSIIEKKPALRKLLINAPRHHFADDSDSSDEEAELDAEENEDVVIYRRDIIIFNSTFQRLLEDFRDGLRTISVERYWRYVLEKLSFPSLPKLRKLILKHDLFFDGEIHGPWASVVSVDFEQLMPRLKELKIIIKTINFKTTPQFLDEFSLAELFGLNQASFRTALLTTNVAASAN